MSPNNNANVVIPLNRQYPPYRLPWNDSLRHMIVQQVAENPDRVEFRFREGKALAQRTVKEFLADIDALGTWLFHAGVHERHVALIAPNSYLWLVVYFAVISGDNVIVPIDKDLSPEELKHLIAHSESAYVFAADKLAKLSAFVTKRLCKELLEADEAEERSKHPLDLEEAYMLVSKDGVKWTWDPYSILPGCYGTPSIFIKWDELEAFR